MAILSRGRAVAGYAISNSQFARIAFESPLASYPRLRISSQMPAKNPQYPPAFCPKHGIFAATALVFGGQQQQLEVVGNLVSCFVHGCSEDCEIIPGRYTVTKKSLNLLIDPSISKDALAAIRDLAVRLRDGKISLEEAHKEVQRVSPAAAGLFSGWTRGEVIAMASAIIAAAALLKPTPAPTVHVQATIERGIDQHSDWQSSSAPTKVPLPRPRPKRK